MYQNAIVPMNKVGVCAEWKEQNKFTGKITDRYTNAGLKISPYFENVTFLNLKVLKLYTSKVSEIFVYRLRMLKISLLLK